MSEIATLDKELFFWLNGLYAGWLDPVMFVLTKTYAWVPLYALFAYMIIKNYRTDGWMVFAGVAVAILLADRITSGLIKPYFERLRPSNDPALRDSVHIVNQYRGGLYGFASSHSANTFAVATLVWLALRPYYKWIALIFLWAAFVSYTRIYLGVHYPGDIIAGSLIGVASGYAGYGLFLWIRAKFSARKVGS